jgi:hypothetical protein
MICSVGAGEAVTGAVGGPAGAGMSKEAVSGVGAGMSSEKSSGTGEDSGVEQADDELDEFSGKSAGERSRCSTKDGPGDPGENGAECAGEEGGDGVLVLAGEYKGDRPGWKDGRLKSWGAAGITSTSRSSTVTPRACSWCA